MVLSLQSLPEIPVQPPERQRSKQGSQGNDDDESCVQLIVEHTTDPAQLSEDQADLASGYHRHTNGNRPAPR